MGLATITVMRKGGSVGNLTVDYATIDGSATAGQDYTSTSGLLNFNGGETSKSFQIPILDDATTEPDEAFTVVLRNASSLESVGTPNTLVITIQDRNTVPALTVLSAAVIEGNSGSTTEALFTLGLSAATGRTVSVNYATVNLSASGGPSCSNQATDYETTSGTMTFQPGDVSLTIPVKICGDPNAEANETFLITLSNPSNATADSQARGTILNDDVLELLRDDSGPTIDQAAALDSVFLSKRSVPHCKSAGMVSDRA